MKYQVQAALNNPQNLEDVARRYRSLMGEIEALEKLLKPYRDTLEQAAIEANGSLDLGTYKVSVTPTSREVFSLKEARQKLGEVLQPYIRVSKFNQLRVVERKAA